MAKIIESKLPIEFISDLSKKEANSRKAIYGIHKWFARKTDAIYRSLLISLETDEKDVSEFNKIFYEDNPDLLKGKIILDPFCGGGTTVINALRLGAKAIGNDLNPMAWFIVKNELQVPGNSEYINKLLNEEYHRLEAGIGREIKEAYTTVIYDKESCKNIAAEIMYTFWIKKCACPHCGEDIKLFPKYRLTRIRTSDEDIHICSKCGKIIYVDKDTLIKNNNIINCENCGNTFNSEKGTYIGRNIICPGCGRKLNLLKDIMARREEPLPMEMYAIEYYNPVNGKREFKVPDHDDIKKFEAIKKAAGKDKEYTSFIDNSEKWKIPQGQNTKQLANHKYYYWTQMFNVRQSYYLFRLLKEIDKIQDQTVKELFLCTFSNMLNANNMFCIYNAQCDKIEPLFGDHHMAPVTNPVENNIWGTRYGRGSFRKYFQILLQAKDFNFHPYERAEKDGTRCNVYLNKESFGGRFAESFNELKNGAYNVMLHCKSSEKLSFIPDRSIDAVVTDPPYYAAINYGEISEFFYTWNRKILRKYYGCFCRGHMSKDEEVTVNLNVGISSGEYCRRLTDCFKEIRRVLKPGAPFIFTYNNSNTEGWIALFDSLNRAGFYAAKAYPVHTELRAGLIDRRRSKMNFDLVFLCRDTGNIKEEKSSINIMKFMKLLENQYMDIKTELKDYHLNENDIYLIKMGIAFEMIFRYRCVNDSGEELEFRRIIGKNYF